MCTTYACCSQRPREGGRSPAAEVTHSCGIKPWALEEHPAPPTAEQPPNPSTGLYLLLISARNCHSS